ncbi:hypothetical protein J6590_040154 [Homalodisca vitripennis]|nr:hypothetical protein J6590_040154 [Homalodisca vitripennis]
MIVIESLANEWLHEKREGVAEGDEDLGAGGDFQRNKFGVMKLQGQKEKECVVCSRKNNPDGQRKRSRAVCANCMVGVHLDCQPDHICKL